MRGLLVGIPTHKRPELLRKCLESVAAQTGDLPAVQVFVADNNPEHREGVRVVEEIAAEYRFDLTSTTVAEPGISAVRNTILAEARRKGAEFIAMIDDDETASPEWLAQLLQVQAEYGADVVGGPTVRNAPLAAPDWLRTPQAFGISDRPTGQVDFVDSTSNVLLSCPSLSRAHWPSFDSAYGLSGGGDTEYFLRLRKAGFRFAWANEARVEEPVPPSRYTTAWFVRRHFRYGNTGDRLNRAYGFNLVPSRSWAVRSVILSPLLIWRTLHPRNRLEALKRLAYAAGILSSALGYRYLEYGERHDRRANSPSGQ